jgi:hypothetical protein
MTIIPFDAYLPLNGRKVHYVPCELEVDVRDEGGYPVMWVTAITTEGQSLPARVREPHTFEQHMAKLILDAAYADQDFESQAFEAFGWSWSGLGANDPDSRWIRPVDPDVMMAAE